MHEMASPRLSRPRIFISSTIYDFRDLRSALKYWLEQMDFEIMLSEENDFTKPLDVSSYEACLQAIDTCDYFILLIGARVGGFYDRKNKITITRMEYRRAYECLQKGSLKLLTFVRKEIWDVRHDRKVLEAFLRDEYQAAGDLTARQVAKIARHKSPFVNDAEATFSFLDEVTRTAEMKEALQSGGDLPKGNWVHTFNTFADVTTTVLQTLKVSGSRRRRGLVLTLTREIISNTRLFLTKREGEISLDNLGALAATKGIKTGSNPVTSSQVTLATINSLVIGLPVGGVKALGTRALDEAIRSGEFLEYAPHLDDYRIGSTQESLIRLADAIDGLKRSMPGADEMAQFRAYVRRGDGATIVSVRNSDLLLLCFVYLHYEAVIERLFAVYRSLNGLPPVPSKPPRELSTMTDIPLTESMSDEEIAGWIRTCRY